MQHTLRILAAWLGAYLLGCGGDARTTLTPPPGLAGGAGGAGSAAGGGGPAAGHSPLGTSGAGGAGSGAADAGADASDAGGGGSAGDGGLNVPDASTDPGGPIPVLIDAESIVFFSLPVSSVRYAAAGFDSATSVCAVIIWDYSNNELTPGPHCDDFGTYPSFPYVVVHEQVQGCDNVQGDYAGVEPEVAQGCFDPLADSVDVELEVFFNAAFYRIVMSNQP